jgi:hypothetical protein
VLFNLYRTYLFLYLVFQLVCPWPLQFCLSILFAFLCCHHRLPFLKTREYIYVPRAPLRPSSDPLYLLPALFSVHPLTAIIFFLHGPLVHLHPHPVCRPTLQRAHKKFKHTRPRNKLSWKLLALSLLGLSSSGSLPTVHSLPSTNYAIVSGQPPLLDNIRQDRLIQNVIETSTRLHTSPPYIALPTEAVSSNSAIATQPYCFVADTESFLFVLHSGANRLIANNTSQFTTLNKQSGMGVKGIGGRPVPLAGIGTIKLP